MVSLQGGATFNQPNTPVINVGGENFYWFDPIQILLTNPNVDAGAVAFWCNSCAGQSVNAASWYSQSEFSSPRTVVCPDDVGPDMSGLAWCTYLFGWAFNQMYSQINGVPQVGCYVGGVETSQTNLKLPANWQQSTSFCQNIVVQLPPSDLVTAFSEADPTQIDAILGYLFPGGVPQPVTLPNMTAAVEAASNPQITSWAESQGTQIGGAESIVAQATGFLTRPDACVVTNNVLNPFATNPEDQAVQLEVDLQTGTPTTVFDWVRDPIGCLKAVLHIGDDVMNCCLEEFGVQVRTCDATTPVETISVPAAFMQDPLHPSQNLHQGNFFQLLVNLLMEIRAAVTTCPTEFHGADEITGDDYLHFQSSDVLDAIHIHINSNPNPARINWQPPISTGTDGVQRFGKANWIDQDGNKSSIFFINKQDQVLFAPEGIYTGFEVYLNADIQATVYYRVKNAYPADPFAYTPSTG